ncbi:hypothetical protein ScalyP_jg9282 [Parmales sp. scaly parma]|nr:hypothetical protein ScalyP_jg9282 [Parmales sp. scaly parma]
MTDIDLDAVPQDVQEALESVAKLGAMGEGIKTELSELLEVFNFSVSMTTNTERKIEETYSEIHFAREQVVASQRMEEEAVVAKHSLQDTIDRSKHKFQEYQTAEINKKDKVVELKANMENLKNKLSKGAGWTPDQEVERKEHITNKENVYRNFDNVKSVLKATRSEVERIEAALELLQRERDLTVKTTGKYERDASDKRDEAKKQSRRKNGLEDSLQNLQAKVKSSREELITREGALKREKSEIVDTEAKLRESKNQMENYLREYDQLFRMTQKLTDDLEVQIHVNDSVDQENGEKTEVLHTRRGEVKLLMKEAAKVAAAKKITSVKIDEIAGEQIVYEKERNSLKEEVDVLVNVDIKGNRKDGEELKKKEATEKRKKEILTRKIGGAEKSTSVI